MSGITANTDGLTSSSNSFPKIVFQTGIPFILAGGSTGGSVNQFTISASGALSNLPPLPFTSGFGFFTCLRVFQD